MANMAFPALILHSYLDSGQVTLAVCSRALLITMALTTAAKVLCEGVSSQEVLPRRQGLIVTGKLQHRWRDPPLSILTGKHHLPFYA